MSRGKESKEIRRRKGNRIREDRGTGTQSFKKMDEEEKRVREKRRIRNKGKESPERFKSGERGRKEAVKKRGLVRWIRLSRNGRAKNSVTSRISSNIL